MTCLVNFYRLKMSELSAEKSQLVQNGPALTSTPFAHQSSLQQELEAQEVHVFTTSRQSTIQLLIIF